MCSLHPCNSVFDFASCNASLPTQHMHDAKTNIPGTHQRTRTLPVRHRLVASQVYVLPAVQGDNAMVVARHLEMVSAAVAHMYPWCME